MINIDYSDNLAKGQEYEIYVSEFFKRKGFETKLNKFVDEEGNETYQRLFIKYRNVCFPDISIRKFKNSVKIEYLVEVKSLGRYKNSNAYAPREKLNPEKYYVSIPQYQFVDYVELSEYLQIKTRVVFVLKPDKTCVWQDIEFLDETKLPVINAYNNGNSHYFWEIEWMRDLN